MATLPDNRPCVAAVDAILIALVSGLNDLVNLIKPLIIFGQKFASRCTCTRTSGRFLFKLRLEQNLKIFIGHF